MLRSAAGVVVGYLSMVVVSIGLFVGLWIVLGVDGVLQPGTYRGNMTLNVAAVLISILASVGGGWVCAKIGKNVTAPRVLAVLMLVIGLTMAIVGLGKPEPGPRAPNVTVAEALAQGNEPTWFAFLNPFIGMTGVLAGSALVKRQ